MKRSPVQSKFKSKIEEKETVMLDLLQGSKIK